MVFTPHQLAALVGSSAPTMSCMGTDYPYDMAEYDPIGHVAAMPASTPPTMPPSAGGNAKRLLGL